MSEATLGAWPIPDTRVPIREWPNEAVSQDGRIVNGPYAPPQPLKAHAARLDDLGGSRVAARFPECWDGLLVLRERDNDLQPVTRQ